MPLAQPSLPQTPPVGVPPHVHTITQDDLDILDGLTSPTRRPVTKFQRREAPLDPLLYAAAVASGPHITRHHYHHDFFASIDQGSTPTPTTPKYVSQQKPRSQRMRDLGNPETKQFQSSDISPSDDTPELAPSLPVTRPLKPTKRPTHLPTDSAVFAEQLRLATALQPPSIAARSTQNTASSVKPSAQREDLIVQCRARTRVPTPHGPVFLHCYHNNRDSKEHLAIVVDPAQLEEYDEQPADVDPSLFIRSQSLDAQWREGETDLERIVRGAYVGRLGSFSGFPSSPTTSAPKNTDNIPPPMIRIHSECFTGETIGSMRCDCGEQLDEAIRRIAQPQTITSTSADGSTQTRTIPGRGAVVYLRQEGRGIGLLEKIRAYNVQDLGYDTVAANVILGHGADERGYEIAAAILRDLNLGSGNEGSESVRLLTNNPDKVEALQKEGIQIENRIAMVPRSWTCNHDGEANAGSEEAEHREHLLRRNGATLIGGGVTYGVELERYLRTKVQRMGHMLDLPSSSNGSATSPSPSGSEEELEDVDDASSIPSLDADEGSSAAPTRPASTTRELVEA